MGAWCLHVIISFFTNQVNLRLLFAMKLITARYLDVSRINLVGVFLEFREKHQSSQCFPMDVTKKKLGDCSSRCFICSSASTKKDKIYVFGRSSCDVAQIIRSALNVYVSRYSENRDLFVCRDKCYKQLQTFQNASDKLTEIKVEIEEAFKAREIPRTKRLLRSELDEENVNIDENSVVSSPNSVTPTRVKK